MSDLSRKYMVERRGDCPQCVKFMYQQGRWHFLIRWLLLPNFRFASQACDTPPLSPESGLVCSTKHPCLREEAEGQVGIVRKPISQHGEREAPITTPSSRSHLATQISRPAPHTPPFTSLGTTDTTKSPSLTASFIPRSPRSLMSPKPR